jgi:heme exporter protein B
VWRDALLVAGKDLRIEARSRIVLDQIVPFGMVSLVVFGLALGPDHRMLAAAAPGLFWVTVVFSALLTIQRSSAVESGEGVRDGIRLSGLDPAGIFLGKMLAVVLELSTLEVLLGAGVTVFFGAHVRSSMALVVACLAGTVGLAATGTLYGALVAGSRLRETLLPLLLVPIAVPVLLGGTRAWEYALSGRAESVSGGAISGGDPWLAVLIVFAVVYVALGVAMYGPMSEPS